MGHKLLNPYNYRCNRKQKQGGELEKFCLYQMVQIYLNKRNNKIEFRDPCNNSKNLKSHNLPTLKIEAILNDRIQQLALKVFVESQKGVSFTFSKRFWQSHFKLICKWALSGEKEEKKKVSYLLMYVDRFNLLIFLFYC